jgi:hypothetical protein
VAFKFLSSAGYLSLASIPAAGDATVSMRIRQDSSLGAGVYQNIFIRDVGGTQTFQINLLDSSLIPYNGNFAGFGSALTIGQWYHLLYTRNGIIDSVYLSGVYDCGMSGAAATGSSEKFHVANNDLGEEARITVESMNFWTVGMTDREAELESHSFAPVKSSGLWAQWPLTRDGVDVFGGHDWTINGSPSIVDGPGTRGTPG